MTDDLDRLETLAKAATAGPWRRGYTWDKDNTYMDGGSAEHLICQDREAGVEVCGNFDAEMGGVVEIVDAEYIAAASPDVVLRLIARIRDLEQSYEDDADARNYLGQNTWLPRADS
jgi:hypothetical protein